MKKKLKIGFCIVVISIVGQLPPNVFAEERYKEVPVTYDTKGPSYLLSVPSSVIFSDKKREIDTSVELLNSNGEKFPESTGPEGLKVTIKSKNGYKLVSEKKDEVSYSVLNSDGKKLTNEDNLLGEFSKITTILKSSAKLNETAKKKGSYTDELTYRIIRE